MPTRKIRDIDVELFRPCRHPEHNPPGMMVYKPGEYEHECPACHHVIRFTVRENRWLIAIVETNHSGHIKHGTVGEKLKSLAWKAS